MGRQAKFKAARAMYRRWASEFPERAKRQPMSEYVGGLLRPRDPTMTPILAGREPVRRRSDEAESFAGYDAEALDRVLRAPPVFAEPS